ncbi:ADP-glyceromanno-heptose 6-epimerase [Mucilaginibacter pallidiroseus]|uniref:ADP-L-glycero-D-manno-heptose-6-epimerase n=2 Tax=Mucilaginibacter pallidiroseus TaxID=2599295 RepID=A0A563UK61_9SPHI|nr:ADP-glyceromanno-heptose 6-epimerase [Mucilaginibacter pallidiroseus]
MDMNQTIIITGAAGFIGSCMVQYLNQEGFCNLILVDDFSISEKNTNWQSKKYSETVERSVFFDWLRQYDKKIACIIHLGARTDTTEFDYAVHQRLNVEYSQSMWQHCVINQIPLIYASSAATYGAGEMGYNDDHDIVEKLKPLNPYGVSKNEFDKWALQQKSTPPFWTGLKFFNVYGPNETHKGRMASVIWHSFNQINSTGLVKLFKSHRNDFKDGQQLRDFVYVKDVLKVIYWMITNMIGGYWNKSNNGLYNLGAGKARSFHDLVTATFKGLDKQPHMEFIDMPEDIRDTYQYFTEAKMHKLYAAGYNTPFYSLEDGIDDYVRNYLLKGTIY